MAEKISGKCFRGEFNIWSVITAPIKLMLIAIVLIGAAVLYVYSEIYWTTDEFCNFDDEPTILNLFNLFNSNISGFTCTGSVFADKDGYTVVNLDIYNQYFDESVHVKKVLCTDVPKDIIDTKFTGNFEQGVLLEPKKLSISFSGAKRLPCVDKDGNWLQLSPNDPFFKEKGYLKFRGTVVVWYNFASDPKDMTPRVAFARLVDNRVVKHYISYTEE